MKTPKYAKQTEVGSASEAMNDELVNIQNSVYFIKENGEAKHIEQAKDLRERNAELHEYTMLIIAMRNELGI
jgi:hypothetical protein